MDSLADLAGLQTEQTNSASKDIDQVSTSELCHIINDEDATVAAAVATYIQTIAAAIDTLAARVRRGGRVIYVGAGTSGRLGILDASEIPPTFSSPEGQFIGIIAGGEAAIRHAREGAEDDVSAAMHDLEALQLKGSVDSLIGIAASGRTPYVLSCLEYAKSRGCATTGVACVEPSAMSRSGNIDFMISPVVGPEIVTGSTRMKAGTATKLVLNMLSTGTMIKIGKTYGNMMVDLKATNLKLRQRSRNMLRTICGQRCPESDESLDVLLNSCQGSVKLAIVTLTLGVSVLEATRRLDEAVGVLANVLKTPVTANPTENSDTDEYVLCVDGGGSKCAAVIMSADGAVGVGEGSSCNVTDVGVAAAVASISRAVQKGCENHPKLRGKQWRPGLFSSIWVGLAGHDRPEVASVIDQSLETVFERSIGSGLTVTNDIDLLAVPAASKRDAQSAIVLVAGTGSAAMAFERQGDQFRRTGRSGGWGHLLGDDGSGFDVGRQGIREVLASMDRRKNFSPAAVNGSVPVSELERRILQQFQHQVKDDDSKDLDLLSAVISGSSELEKKKRIAQVARVVVDASETDPKAKTIVNKAVQNLVRLLDPFVESKQVDPQKSTLVLGGGLMQNTAFSTAVKKALKDEGTTFRYVEVVSQPAMSGAEYLWRRRKDSA